VWSPFDDKMLFKLSGHGAPLIGVQFVGGELCLLAVLLQRWFTSICSWSGTAEVITADSDG
jgi:hypothetical protein